MRPLTRAERRELTALRTVPLPMAPEHVDRYCHLAYRDEEEFREEIQRLERWERRRLALRTLVGKHKGGHRMTWIGVGLALGGGACWGAQKLWWTPVDGMSIWLFFWGIG